MKTSVYNQKGEVVGEVELNPRIFEVKPSEYLLAEAVRVQRSNSRQGSSHTKTRGEVSGGGKKPWKQKGTGRARVGSIRSPIWRKGGITFGPRSNQNWHLKINKKAKTKALFMSLSDKAQNKQMVILDQISLSQPKTKEFASVLSGLNKSLNSPAKKILFIYPKKNEPLRRAARNLKNLQYLLADSLNLIDVIKSDSLYVLKDSLPVIEKTYLSNSKLKMKN